MKSKKKSKARTGKKKALGRGLDSLIPEAKTAPKKSSDYFHCNISRIRANPYQPRTRFSKEELKELSDSIKNKGIIQPLIVRKNKDGYELITGERRLRASKIAGLKKVPVIVKKISDLDMLEMSIIENIQREDLNPIEEADAYNRLMIEFDLTQEQVAGKVGKSRSAVANFLRLRQLPSQIRESMIDGSISMGHARALLGAATSALQNAAWRKVISKGLSVRDTEALINGLKKKKKKIVVPAPGSNDIYFASLENDLSRLFGTRVKIKRRGKKGSVQIEYYGDDDLDRVLNLLKK